MTEEEKYNLVFENVYDDIYNTMKLNPKYTIENLQSLLDSLYIVDGNDWLGRGERQDIISTATIAAAETILADWKKELKSNEE